MDHDEMEEDEFTEQENANMKKWLKQYKPLMKQKMTQNIQTRQCNSTKKIHEAIISTIRKYNIDVSAQSLDVNNKIKPIRIETQGIKQKFWSKVDEWNGLEGKCEDFAKYKKNGDGWFNRYKAVWFGDYFFDPLLRTILPQYIQNVINNYNPNDPLSVKQYDLLYFHALNGIIHSQIPFARTKYMALISKQAFIASKCKKTLQDWFTKLGRKYGVDYDNRKHKRGKEAYEYAKDWVKEILEKVEGEYQQIINAGNNGYDEIKRDDTNNGIQGTAINSLVCQCEDNYGYGDVDRHNDTHIVDHTQQTQDTVQPEYVECCSPSYHPQPNCNNNVYHQQEHNYLVSNTNNTNNYDNNPPFPMATVTQISEVNEQVVPLKMVELQQQTYHHGQSDNINHAQPHFMNYNDQPPTPILPAPMIQSSASYQCNGTQYDFREASIDNYTNDCNSAWSQYDSSPHQQQQTLHNNHMHPFQQINEQSPLQQPHPTYNNNVNNENNQMGSPYTQCTDHTNNDIAYLQHPDEKDDDYLPPQLQSRLPPPLYQYETYPQPGVCYQSQSIPYGPVHAAPSYQRPESPYDRHFSQSPGPLYNTHRAGPQIHDHTHQVPTPNIPFPLSQRDRFRNEYDYYG